VRRLLWNVLPALGLAACSFSESDPRYDTGLDELDIVSVQPEVAVPGTVLVVEGRSFVEAPWGTSTLVLTGTFDDGGQEREVVVRAPARFADFEHLEVVLDDEVIAPLGSWQGELRATAVIEVASSVDGQLHLTPELDVTLSLRPELTPQLAAVQESPTIFANDDIAIEGAGMLLGGAEGTTLARVEGCFAPEDDAGELGECAAVGPVDLAVTPASRFDREHGTFRFAPEIAGIRGGEFRGQVLLRNQHADGVERESKSGEMVSRMAEAEVQGVAPGAVSLGQYLEVEGGGFVGGADDQVTLLQLVGEYVRDGEDAPIAIDTVLVPEFVSGRSVRYVMNEDDDLGQVLLLRGGTGRLSGTITPIVSFRTDEVTGPAREIDLEIAPLVQVVYLNFTPQYVSSLQHFGLRATDALIRERVLDVVRRDYRTINIDLRTEPPADFSLYSEVEVGGPDPNGLGLLGYDNTPGKDVGNLRLYDRIGGVNATTQADGFPGYGGVFVESLFIFSQHPDGLAPDTGALDPTFDDIFDPFRPDQDGIAVVANELLSAGQPDSGDACPADSRQDRLECAVWVLGSLIGTTVSHELGHSLGLANPDGGDVHIVTDEPDRLMEAGGGRTFSERAELDGEGPGMFCDREYTYLRTILPSDEPDDTTPRPDCF
jgi:hypothetical protein